MPNWKRVIVSGSDATLTSVIATAGFTGSLFGTASYATNALSASYAQTASYVLQAVSASYATTASYATYAANGGVTQLAAGSGIILSPTGGTGVVTVSSTGGSLYNTATGSYGSFYDTGSVLATSATAVYSMSLSTTDISNGVFVSASNGDVTRVKFTNAGTYNLQFSSQFSNTDNSNQDIIIWVKKNGVDIPDSSGVAAAPPFKAGSNGQVIAAWNYYLSLSAGDFIQMCWHVEQANVITLETIAAGTSPTHPRTPSTILTATRVDTFLSNTGSFSGSFTGDLLGTASYATQALSASQAISSSNASLATNVVGSANRILFNNGTNTTTTSNNLTWTDSTNLLTLGDGTGPAGTINKLALYTASFGGYGFGVSPAQLDYVSDGSHVFYKKGVIPTELVRIANNGDVNITSSLTVTNGITGTLFGTASYATQALSASYAPSTPAFPYTGSALITGSLGVTGSLSNGDGNIASGLYSHAEGQFTTATGEASHTEGQSTNAIGTYSHAEGLATIASGSYQHVQGQYNIASSAQSAFIVGNGGNIASRSNLIFAAGSQVEITGSLVVTAGITGSMLGTASYATQALSASWAPGGAGTPTFPYTGSAIISGSLELTGSLLVQDIDGKTNIDSRNRQLYVAPLFPPSATAVLSVDWGSRTLNDTNGNSSVSWRNRDLLTSNSVIGLDWTDDTYLSSDVYQRDYKSAATQDAVSTTYNDPSKSYLGDIIESDGITTVIDSTVTAGMLVYLDTNTVWYPVNQAATGATKLLGIAHNLQSLPPNPPPFPTNQSGQILLEGHVVIDDTSFSGPNVQGADHGLPIYIRDGTTQGLMSTTTPTSTGGPNIVRLLGHCYQQNSGTSTQWMMKFRPSNDWVEI